MPSLFERVRRHTEECVIFVRWMLYSCLIGVIVGLVAVAFHLGIDWAAELRGEQPRLIWLLPLGGVSIVLLYRLCGMEKDRGTNLVLVAVRDAERLKLRTAPLIFLSTILTHLVGGSAGREGAALHLQSLGPIVYLNVPLEELSRRKCAEVAASRPEDLVIAADTLVEINGRVLGNILAYSAGSRPLLREGMRTLFTLALIALLARVVRLWSWQGLLLCAAALLALALCGAIPAVIYQKAGTGSIVERLREN